MSRGLGDVYKRQSVNCENAKSFFQEANIDGALIGGASLNGKEFLDIYNDFLETF